MQAAVTTAVVAREFACSAVASFEIVTVIKVGRASLHKKAGKPYAKTDSAHC